ncbi:MAG: response regulator [Clostridia bacterium]|nr:response regulator [Clostridia bacterium]NCC42169.1 response regulator [Clostridia bacterium]
MINVVIIEDDPMVAAINRQYMSAIPQIKIIGEFRNGKEALEFVSNNQVDLAVIDYYMPVMDGMEFVKRCREENLKIDVIIITAANNASEISAFWRLGIVDYLVKPFTYQRFNQSIEKYIKTRTVIRQNGSLKQEEIDQLLAAPSDMIKTPVLDKGLQEKTLDMIRDYLKESKGTFLSSNEIASKVNLSRITVRRYMNYLVENREIISQIDYSTGGRPSIKYKKYDL